ncbi:hypothetical protein FHQ18_09925 [Deferribacter autotrophicus]|uniref:Tetratricopeptide repeat protein n=1 Tax=Deferribacter autotrophicus TaxID=500465 RepID=A0A5A8F214_9BACT|nr:hypothetical protein [Deferribacter autotrophicus]KAA0257355.1 hypothetical protein FHQ18_09925 [Deferribacter autotrophicus]
MSLIAEALKKNKKKKKVIKYKKVKSFSSLNFGYIYFLVFILFILLIGVDYIFINKNFINIKLKKRPPINKFSKIKNNKINNYNKKLKELEQDGIVLALMENNLENSFNLMRKNNKYDYLGIYNFKRGNIGLAEKQLYGCFKKYKETHENEKMLCGYYLALIKHMKKDFNTSLEILLQLNESSTNGINIKCEKNLLYATNYEALGRLKQALLYYENAKNNCELPPVKHKILLKTYFLKNRGKL